jgi:hypothetical protein
MAVGDSFPALMAFTLVGAYFLQRTLFADETFCTVVLSSLAVNVLLKGLYNLVIWPFFINPLRHLPKVPVSITSREHYQRKYQDRTTNTFFLGLHEQRQVLRLPPQA